MTKYLIQDTTLAGIADAIRTKTGGTDAILVSDMASQIEGITVGSSGGTVEGVHYVTFMSHDGATVLYTRPVADGDDCADPVNRGLIEAPTREETVQYTYSYVGWATTPNGAWDTSALENVTEDRTVYAAYASAVRYYTITYYDSDGTTVLKTEQVAYGSVPTYEPTKDGYDFVSWTPALSAVTGDTSYTAAWEELTGFAAAEWAEIAERSANGTASTAYSVGDTKTVTVGDETMTVQIVGFNHDDLADGTGKAGISIMVYQALSATHAWDSDGTSTTTIGWKASDIREYLNSELYASLPEDLQSVIKPVTKLSDGGRGSTSLVSTTDTLWLPSAEEVLVAATTTYMASAAYSGLLTGQGSRYEHFATKVNGKRYTSSGSSAFWNTRSGITTTSYTHANIICIYDGYGEEKNRTVARPVVFGFCV